MVKHHFSPLDGTPKDQRDGSGVIPVFLKGENDINEKDGHVHFDKGVEICHRLAIGECEFRVSSKSYTLFDGSNLAA